MNIISAQYTESGGIEVTTDYGFLCVPNNNGNRHRVMITDWVAEGGSIDPYVAPPTYATADEAKAAMVVWINEFTAGVTGPIPKDEKHSWGAKEPAAIAYLAGTADASQYKLLQGEADITGETLTELSNAVVTRADAFRDVVSRVSGIRRATNDLIDAEADPANYETILINARTQALAMAAALGL